MAQVYAMSAMNGIKIGWTTSVQRRYRELSRGIPGGVTLIGISKEMPLDEACALEASLHDRFSDKKMHHEWFGIEEEDLLRAFVELSVETVSLPKLTLIDGPKRYPEKQVASFEVGTFARIDAVRNDKEDRTDFYREAVEILLKRRERMKEQSDD